MTSADDVPPIVLVVEDEPLLLEFCTHALRAAGFVVLAAETGDIAARLIQEQRTIDVLFTDIRMPGALDGWDLAELFQQRFPRSGIIYATGYSPEVPRQMRGSLFLRKPYGLDAIIKAVRELVARAQLMTGFAGR